MGQRSYSSASTGREGHDAATRTSMSAEGFSGPQLVDDYGPRVWAGNEAMVQANSIDVARAAQASIDRDIGLQSATPSIDDQPVDLDFQQATASTAVAI